ncbi:MAG: Zn-ribbon domain-containing OB-fold protein [Candidatus Odinarchaeia archaeon]
MESNQFTIKQFLKYIKEGKLRAVKCKMCGETILPPRYKCTACGQLDFEWIDLKGEGILLTYSVIYVPPKRFKDDAPYIIGIVELDEGLRVEARINGIDVNNHEKEVKTGMKLKFNPGPEGILAFTPL